MNAEDRWLCGWVIALCAASAVLLGFNAAFHGFTWLSYIPRPLAPVPVVMLELAACAPYVRRRDPRLGAILHQAAFFGLTCCAVSLMTTGIQVTPFATIDMSLYRWDKSLGVDVLSAMRWTAAHPYLRSTLEWSYFLLNIELFALPFALCFLDDRRPIRVYMYAVLYAVAVGESVYYFFPSSGPASLLQSPLFTWEQLLTGRKFLEIHSRMPVESLNGGMVAFPSFHVIWAILLTWCGRRWPWLAILNGLVLLSTVLLGWHYLTDVLAGAALAAASLWAAERTHERFRSMSPS